MGVLNELPLTAETVLEYAYYLPLVTLVGYVVYMRYLSPLAGIPGPFWASLSRFWLAYRAAKGDTHQVMPQIHKKYGNLVRTGPNEVSFADLQTTKKVYGAGSGFRKSDWYSVWQQERPFDLFGERNEKVHAAQRKLVSGAYSMSSLKDLEPYVDSAVECFEEQMQARSGKSIDFALWLQLFSFDVIGEVTFSKRFGFMEAGGDGGIFKKIESILFSGAWVGQALWIYKLDRLVPSFIGSRLAINQRDGYIVQYASRSLQERQERGSDHRDILAKLLETQKQKPDEMPDYYILAAAATNIFAGSDTTAISLRSFVYHVLKNPACKTRLVHEIDNARKNGKLSDPVTFDEASNLPYFQACLEEALRIHPATGMTLGRVVPQSGLQIGGHFIPPGYVVGTNPWVLAIQESIYGADPESFRPERWLKEENGGRDLYKFGFGAGSRLCIGKNISWMEMSKLLPSLFMKFHVELTYPEREWTSTCWWFVKQEDFYVTMKPRLLS